MRTRPSYEVLREAQRDAETRPTIERSEPAERPSVVEREPDHRNDLERHEAARDALTQHLDQQVQAGRIDRAELAYQLNRFENGTYRDAEPAAPQQSRDATGDRATAYGGDRADMVSQQREAMERLRENQPARQEMDSRFGPQREAAAEQHGARRSRRAFRTRRSSIPGRTSAGSRPRSDARTVMNSLSQFPRGVPGRNLRDNIAPHATWADPAFIAAHPHWQHKPGKIFLGAIGDKPIGVIDDRHIMTIAGNRAGKGVSAIVPNLLDYPGSVIATDPKGELAAITRNWRAEGLGQDVFVLDPFGVSGHVSARFNPLTMIDPDADTAIDDAALIAEAVFIQEEGPGRHFSSGARNFARGAILESAPANRQSSAT